MNEDEPTVRLPLRLAFGLAMFGARFSRPMLLGVRGIVADEQQRVFLVRHSYVPGWHLPGGGVERGETLVRSLERELAEEANIVLEGEPLLHGVFFNRKLANRDHIAVYVVRRFRQTAPRLPDREIVESGFFPRARLPTATTRAVRQRLAEVFDGAPISPLW